MSQLNENSYLLQILSLYLILINEKFKFETLLICALIYTKIKN
jgi:hypothetical protein